MLMVVFGAGASFDSYASRRPENYPSSALPDRPPLANQLFEDRAEFVRDVSRFEKCKAIIPFLRHFPPESSLERQLERLRAESERYAERHKQLAAIRYYLHLMLWGCENRWAEVHRGATNYRTLLDQIESWRRRSKPVCLVTFNYDTMIEAALSVVNLKMTDLPHYVESNRYKYIKLHGSVNWARQAHIRTDHLSGLNSWQIAWDLIERAPGFKLGGYEIVSQFPAGKGNPLPLFPAIAIPVEAKQEYECPEDHLTALLACVPEVTDLLVVGWRASERHFLHLLATHLKHELRVLVVAGGPEKANEPIAKMQEAGIKGQFSSSSGGFSDFIVQREGDDFLKAADL